MAESLRTRLERVEEQAADLGDDDYPHIVALHGDGTYTVAGNILTAQEYQAWLERGERLGKFSGPVIVMDC